MSRSGWLFLLSFILLFCSRRVDGFAEWYATRVYPLFPNTIGRLFSPLPYSFFEGVVLVTVFLFVCWILAAALLLLTRSKKRKMFFQKSGRIFLVSGSLFLLVFTLTGAINYSRAPVPVSIGLTEGQNRIQELEWLSLKLISDLNALEMELSPGFQNELFLAHDQLSLEVITAMKQLGEFHPSLSGYYPAPKPIKLSKGLSALGITGIYSPFTMEANYNKDVAPYLVPYTMAHELAHLKGFMREEEAGFIAFLACSNSDSKALNYSGALNGLQYVMKALKKEISPIDYEKIYAKIPQEARKELEKSMLYWKEHTSTVTDIARKANDRYLLVNAQADGTGSYGKMVDYMLAYYGQDEKTAALI